MSDRHESFSAGMLDRIQSYRWPKKGDRLLMQSQDCENAAEISSDVISRHVHIWDGNMRAGAVLIGACGENNPDRHSLIYPILLNYRRAIELAMKWIIFMYGRRATVQIDDYEHHDLWKLWCLCKLIIVEFGSEDEAIPVVEQIIKDFHDLDGSGQAFRYAYSKAGTLVELPNYPIDLPHIQDVMEGIGHFFDGADAQLDGHCSAADW